MADFAFSQPERRSFLPAALISVGLLAAVFGAVFYFTPHRIADVTVTHTEILPTHTIFKSNSIVVGRDQEQDDLYVLATVRIDDQLRLPLRINDITATLTTAEGEEEHTSAVQKQDIAGMFVTFPKLKPLASAPLTRETEVPPGQHAEGMVMLHFSVPRAVWDGRKSAVITIDTYHQGPLTVTIPKP
jgi:hypothetical protein